MHKRIVLTALIISVIAAESSAQNHTNRRRGVILGGLAGAALGVAIGDKSDKETEGALIGGAVGAIAGGALGNAKDERIEQDRRYHLAYPAYGQTQGGYRYDDHYHHPPVPYRHGYQGQPVHVYAPPPAPVIVAREPVSQAVSTRDVIAMVRSGMSEPMIIQQIQIRGVQRDLSVSDVIDLHEQGVSEPIINAMQGIFPVFEQPHRYPKPGQSYRVPTKSSDHYGTSIMAPSNGR